MPFVPSPRQQDFFNWVSHGEGSAILEAVAGAGKTTTIVRGAELMDGTVCMLAYNSKMAAELKERVAGMDGVEAKTFHGAGFSALRRAFKSAPWAQRGGGPDDKKVRRIVDALIAEKGRDDLLGLEDTVCDIVSMAKQRGIGALSSIVDEQQWYDMIDHFALDENLPEGQEHMIPQLVKLGQICLKRSNETVAECIDFDDMVYVPLQRGLRMWQFDWLLVDEAQDTNPTRRALARKMLRPGGRLVAVGDPHQAIYGFTGTDNDSLDQIARDFGCIRLPLTVTYRCPKAVVAVARQWVDHIEAHETAPQGEVVRYDYEEILDRVRIGDAVLCRYNKPLVSLVFKLIKAGVPAKIEGRAIGEGLVRLAGKWKVATLDALAGRLEKYLEREVAKAKARGDERKVEEVHDRVDTMHVLIDRARELKHTRVTELQEMIRTVFDDRVVDAKNMVTLCSGHRSKGLEWDRVHILGLEELQPGRAKHDWQLQQEFNLMYVEVTRAKQTLHIVSGLREDRQETPNAGR